MKQVIYRDADYIGGGGDSSIYDSFYNDKYEKHEYKPGRDAYVDYQLYQEYLATLARYGLLKTFDPTSSHFPYLYLSNISTSTNAVTPVEEPSKFDEEIVVAMAMYDEQNLNLDANENSANAMCRIETVHVKVKKNNTLKMSDLKESKIRHVQFLHSLAFDKEEFRHIHSEFWPDITHRNIDLDEFGLYVLGMREIYAVTNDERFKLLNVKRYDELKFLYTTSCPYLIFSKSDMWRRHVCQYIKLDKENATTAWETDAKFVQTNFTDAQIKKLVSAHYDNVAQIDKVAQCVKKKGELFKLLNSVKVFDKNKDVFLSHNVDFNAIKVTEANIANFEIETQRINGYKILNKLLARLDAKKRNEIKSHTFVFNDYINLCESIYRKNQRFEQLEPIIKKIHTYETASDMYAAFNSILNPNNLYAIYEKVQKTKNVKVIYFNEGEQNLLVRVDSYRAMSKVGATQWCIARDRASYFQYKLVFGRFYIYYSATPLREWDIRTFVGFTVRSSGRIAYAHDECDRDVLGLDSCSKVINRNRKFLKGRFQ